MPVDLIGSLNDVIRSMPSAGREIQSRDEVGQFVGMRASVLRLGRSEPVDAREVGEGFLDLPYGIAVPESGKLEALSEVLERPFFQRLLPVSDVMYASTAPRAATPSRPAGAIGHEANLPSDLGADMPILGLVRGLLEQDKVLAARKLLVLGPVPDDPEAQKQIARLQTLLAPPIVKRTAYSDRERSREYAWLSRYGPDYRGRWVAIDGDDLIAHAASLRELREAIRGTGRKPLVHRVD